ncbi:MAG: hypothetical protein ACI8RZ_003872, partial [Myxococcota bacterium]
HLPHRADADRPEVFIAPRCDGKVVEVHGRGSCR